MKAGFSNSELPKPPIDIALVIISYTLVNQVMKKNSQSTRSRNQKQREPTWIQPEQ